MLLGAACAALGACGDPRSDPATEIVVDTLPNGAAHVRNPETGIWRDGQGWRLIEELRIGAIDGEGPEVFGQIRGIEADVEGRIYVADRQASEVRVFAPDGRHLRTFGREGAGPGEFRQIAGLAWHPDGNLWVNDPPNARFAVLHLEQGFLTSHRREAFYQQFPWLGRLGEDGNLYEVALSEGDGSAMRRQRLIVRHAPPEFEPVDSLSLPVFDAPSFEFTYPDGRGVASVQVPFGPSQIWSIAADGGVWIGTTDRYRIHRVNRSGDTLRVVERAHTPVPVSATERQAALDGLRWFTDQGGRVDASRIPDTKPAFGPFFEDDRGYLWVSGTVAEDEAPRFDVFDPAGRYLGAVEAAERADFLPPVVRGDRFYAVVRDDLDVEYLSVHRIDGRS